MVTVTENIEKLSFSLPRKYSKTTESQLIPFIFPEIVVLFIPSEEGQNLDEFRLESRGINAVTRFTISCSEN